LRSAAVIEERRTPSIKTKNETPSSVLDTLKRCWLKPED